MQGEYSKTFGVSDIGYDTISLETHLVGYETKQYLSLEFHLANRGVDSGWSIINPTSKQVGELIGYLQEIKALLEKQEASNV